MFHGDACNNYCLKFSNNLTIKNVTSDQLSLTISKILHKSNLTINVDFYDSLNTNIYPFFV